jgi:FlaA1/EpsC-like NDP-sugar epimerase
MSIDEATNLIISTLELISENKNLKRCRTFICDMGTPIKIKNLALKMLYLSGRTSKKYISNSYYGLNNMEKISENLISKKEKIINIINEKILEINSKYKIVYFNKIKKIITDASKNHKIKRDIKKMI